MNLTSLRKLAKELGYGIYCNVTDALRRKWKYKTAPISGVGGGGPTNYFNNLEEIETYLKRCEQIRSWQMEVMDTQE